MLIYYKLIFSLLLLCTYQYTTATNHKIKAKNKHKLKSKFISKKLI